MVKNYGSKPGSVQSTHLNPVTGVDHPHYKKFAAGRDKYHKDMREAKQRRQRYADQLAALKSEQLETVKKYIDDDSMIQSPADMLMSMIKEQQMIVANENIAESLHHKERQLLLSMFKEYALLTGANAPSAQSVDITSEPIEVKSPEEIQNELLNMTASLKTLP